MKNITKLILGLGLVAGLTACGGGSTSDEEDPSTYGDKNSPTTCTFEQVGELSAHSATGNIVCSDADGIRNTDDLPAVVTVNSIEYRLKFADGVTSFDEDVTVTGLSENTKTSASAVLFVVNGNTGEVDRLSVGTTDLETNLVPDTVKPVITVTGGTTALTVGGVYTPPTVTASDDVDGDITASIVEGGDIVNPNVVGTYIVTYEVTDSSGNAAATKIHTVVVTAAPVTNKAPTCDNFTVTLPDFTNSFTKDLTPLMHDANPADTLTATYEGSGVLPGGDPVISDADVVGNEVFIIVSSGTGSGYIDYTVSDGTDTSTKCRITVKNLDGN